MKALSCYQKLFWASSCDGTRVFFCQESAFRVNYNFLSL